eukprot:3559167-Pyramimonas_sp.AAC.1
MFAHNCRRHPLSSGSGSQQMHARMRATARRRRPAVEAKRLGSVSGEWGFFSRPPRTSSVLSVLAP